MTDWTNWSARERAVLVFVREGDQVLLIHKKRGLGKGKVNGPGGRVEPGETWVQAALRETQEETGLTPGSLSPAAEIWFQFVDGYSLDVRVFVGQGAEGTLTPCDEADPFWHPVRQIPWAQMWADDALWLPQVLAGRYVEARFLFDGEAMKEAEIGVQDRPPGPKNG